MKLLIFNIVFYLNVDVDLIMESIEVHALSLPCRFEEKIKVFCFYVVIT